MSNAANWHVDCPVVELVAGESPELSRHPCCAGVTRLRLDQCRTLMLPYMPVLMMDPQIFFSACTVF